MAPRPARRYNGLHIKGLAMKLVRANPVAEPANAAATEPSSGARGAAQAFADKRIDAVDAHIQGSPRMQAQRRQISEIPQAAAPVQRKNLSQANLAGGLALVDEGTRTLVGDGRNVNIYYRSADVEGDRTDGLVKAAALNAEVGKRVDSWGADHEIGRRKDQPWKQNNMYTPAKKALNTTKVPNVDPYFLYVTIRYGRSDRKELEQLDVVYQHAPAFTGYVEQIMDTGNDATKDYPSMFNVNDEVGGGKVNAGDVVGERNLKYSNVHHQGDGSAISALTSGKNEKGLDAYTKIAGEGARWQAVRHHARALKDSSRFYTADPASKAKVYRVDFVSLWLSWDSAFGKQYDISNAFFAKMLVNNWKSFKGEGVRTAEKTAMTADDYNLDG
jgi:hypothetical protein